MAARKVLVFQSGAVHPIYPQCARTQDREYQSFCGRRRQRPDGRGFKRPPVPLTFPETAGPFHVLLPKNPGRDAIAAGISRHVF